MGSSFVKLSRVLNMLITRTANIDDNINDEQNHIYKDYLINDIVASDSSDTHQYSDELSHFNKGIRLFYIYGNAWVLGQIASFSIDKCIVVIMLNSPEIINTIKLDGNIININQLGAKVTYQYDIIQGYYCYYLKVVKPIFKPYSHIELQVISYLSLSKVVDKSVLQDKRVTSDLLKFADKGGMICKLNMPIDDLLYFLYLYFGYEKLYTVNEYKLTSQEFGIWYISSTFVNVNCKYIDLDGANARYFHNVNSVITRTIDLPFICDIHKVTEMINRFLLKEKVLVYTIKYHKQFFIYDIIYVNIGYLQYRCQIIDCRLTELDDKSNFQQYVIAQILNEKLL